MLSWAGRFNIFCFLDNQQYSIKSHQFECLLAAGNACAVESADIKDADVFLNNNKGWTFGHLAYDLKNSIHHFKSALEKKIDFPLYFLFRPQILICIKQDLLTIEADKPDTIYRQINSTKIKKEFCHPDIPIRQRLTKEEYMQKVSRLQEHILRGDCYEINFCQEFFAEKMTIEPVDIFEKLMLVSPNPFSALYKLEDKYLICASPERFLAKEKDRIFSQPMKGTIKRNLQDKEEDENFKKALRQSGKDQSENVMVVDLVRNDLSKICIEASVTTDELFGVYTYPQVHQMISTISGNLKPGTSFSDIISATFPMGSMTGAPKHRVMELIDQYESSGRGIFSGSVGYIDPKGDFDFNVVIRSIMYNASDHYLSYRVGSGITFYSDPEKEWEECLLKGEAIRQVLSSK